MQRGFKLAILLTSIVTMLGLLPGCGDTVEDVNRVQPYYVTKSALEGEWHFRQTVVDRPPEFAYLFTGIEGALEKIRWEIRESQLFAYRVHPAVPGLEDDATLAGAEYKGSPVAVYSITSHFDIVRDFNRSTGEQSNLVYEDASLRPWNEREYMRVDWSTNLIDGPAQLGLGLAAWPGTSVINYEEIDDNPYDPDRFRLEDDFIFITSNYITTDGGMSCILTYGQGTAGGWDNCGPVEVKIRSSFARIDQSVAEQFEAVEYFDREVMKSDAGEPLRYTTVSVGPDRDTMVDVACTDEVLALLHPEVTLRDCKELSWGHFNRFGYFRSERKGYDRRVGGGHDSTREYYANYHQMWKRTKDADCNRIPYAQREVRPIIYYINANFPEDLKSVAVKVSHDWNKAFTAAATSATGRTAEQIAEQLRADHDGTGTFLAGDDLGAGAIFQIRENNCSVPGVEAYLARNPAMVTVSFEATRGKPLLPGNLKRVCSALRYFSEKQDVEEFEWQQMGDLRYSFLWWINEDQPNGPLGYGPSSTDVESGQIISGTAHIYGGALDGYARGAADVVRALNGDLELADIIDGHSYMQWIERGTSVADNPAEPNPEMQQEISRRIGSHMPGKERFMNPDGSMDKAAMLRHMRMRLKDPHPSDPVYSAVNAPVNHKESVIEALRDDPAKRNLLVAPEMLQLLGPLYNWAPGDDVPGEMLDMAFDMSINPDALRKREEARFKHFSEHNVYLGEFLDDSIVGLALELKGLAPEEVYKRLRAEIFEAVSLHEIGHTVGLRHNFKASTDALNYQDEFWQIREQYPEEEWNNARLPEYRYASIMDYGARFNSDLKGLGRYDVAAIKYLYGGRAEVFDEAVAVPGRLDLELEFSDYTKIPDMLGGDTSNLTKRSDADVRALIEAKREGVFENAARLVENRERPAADYWIDRTVPYAYCTDSYNGDLKCRTWDSGANETEAVQSAIQRYWNYYLFNSYRRGREAGSFINSYFGRQNRVLDYLLYPWQYYYFYDAYPVDLRDDLLKASMMGLNFVTQVIGTPEPGNCRFTDGLYLPASVFRRDYQQQCDSVNIGIGAGRDQYLKYNDNHVYDIDYIGSYYDKMNIMVALAFNSTRFFKVTDSSDSRAFSVGYYRVFKEELLKLSRDLMLGTMMNWTTIDGQPEFIQDSVYGPLVVDGDLQPQLLVDPARFTTNDRATAANAPQVFTSIPFNPRLAHSSTGPS